MRRLENMSILDPGQLELDLGLNSLSTTCMDTCLIYFYIQNEFIGHDIAPIHHIHKPYICSLLTNGPILEHTLDVNNTSLVAATSGRSGRVIQASHYSYDPIFFGEVFRLIHLTYRIS